MKVGVIGPLWLNIPPVGYGGTELVVYNLVQGLTKDGHDVTLFGPKTAQVDCKVIPTIDAPLREQNIPWTDMLNTLHHITEAFDRAGQFDILHMHLNKSQDYLALPLALHSKTPVVFTFHFKLPTLQDNPLRYAILTKYNKFPYTSISNSQRGKMPLNFIATVYNSLNIAEFPLTEKPEDYFIWLGKVNPLKGTKEAILAAKKAGVKLKVLGAIDEGVPAMKDYYYNEIKPLIDGTQITWYGTVTTQEKAKLLGGAKAFLNPILWEEPFGLVMAEAQATGTPVISFNRGAAPEVIVNGKTGFLINTLDEMVEKMKVIDTIDRKTCRANIVDTFSVEAMATNYEKAYEATIARWEEYVEEQKMEIEEAQGSQRRRENLKF